MKEIICVVVPVGEKPFISKMEDNLSSIQKMVDGNFEIVRLTNRLLILCDEEAKCKSKPGNRKVGNDIIAGQFVVVADDDGDFSSLSKLEINLVTKIFETPQFFTTEEVEETIYLKFIEN